MANPTPEEIQKVMQQLAAQGGATQPQTLGWQDKLTQIQGQRAVNPARSPVASGTPTQGRLQMEQQQRQFEAAQALQREQMAQQERLARMSASRAGGSVGDAGGDPMWTSVVTVVNEAIRGGLGWDFVERMLRTSGADPDLINKAYSLYRTSAYNNEGEFNQRTQTMPIPFTASQPGFSDAGQLATIPLGKSPNENIGWYDERFEWPVPAPSGGVGATSGDPFAPTDQTVAAPNKWYDPFGLWAKLKT